MLQIALSVASAVGVFLVFMVAVSFVGRESNAKRLKRIAPTQEEAEQFMDRARGTDSSGLAGDLEPLLKAIGLKPAEFRRINFFKFYRAGVSPVNGPVYFLAWRLLATPLALALAWYLLSDESADSLLRILYLMVSGFAVAAAWFGPNILLANMRQKRQKIIQRSFPDALDLLLVCTESGLALDGALARVCRELSGPHPLLTDELNKTRMELTLLNDRERALQNLSERVDLVAVRSLVAALLQTERFGTNLNETLRVLADEYRNTRLMTAEQIAGRLPVIMTIPLILLMMPAFLMIVMGPAVINSLAAF